MADGGGRNAYQDHRIGSDDDDSGPPVDEANAPRRNLEEGGITEPQPLDVLLGRGRRNAFHPGNRRFQATIEMNQARFNAAASKLEKTRISQEIVNLISERGRFLKFDRERGRWVEVDDEVARTKVSHACRYKQRRRSSARTFPPPILSAEAEVAAAWQAVGPTMLREEETETGFTSNNEHSSPGYEPPSIAAEAVAAAVALPQHDDYSQDEDSEFSEHQRRQSPLSYPPLPENSYMSNDEGSTS